MGITLNDTSWCMQYREIIGTEWGIEGEIWGTYHHEHKRSDC